MSSRRTPTTDGRALPQGEGGPARPGLTALYRSVGEELHHFDVDVESASLTRRGTVAVPAGVQYVWPHPSGQYLYVASSNRGPGATGTTGSTSSPRGDSGTLLPLT